MEPNTGAVEGAIQYTTANGSPVWKLAQWYSQNSIYGVIMPAQLAAGAWKRQNLYQVLVDGADGYG